jgi:hypothetical protein
MRSRHFENKARQSFWLVHIEAWRRSGLSQTLYCRKHRLARNVFARWPRWRGSCTQTRGISEYCVGEERRQQRDKRGKKPQRQRYGVSTDVRNKAIQAFWAMHVEAMNWSGMGVGEYAAALSLSPRSLRKWHDRFENWEVEIDWRAHLHPSARPKISTSASSAAKDQATESLLTTSSADPSPSQRSNRRSFTDEEKFAIVLESDQSDVRVAEVCRRHGIVSSMMFRRIQFGFAQKKAAKLATVVQPVEGIGVSFPPFVLNDLLQPPDSMMVVDLDDGRRVFAPIGCDPDVVRKHVPEQEAAQ